VARIVTLPVPKAMNGAAWKIPRAAGAVLPAVLAIADAMTKGVMMTGADATVTGKSIPDAAQVTANGMSRGALKAGEVIGAKAVLRMGSPTTVTGMIKAGMKAAVKIIAEIAPPKAATALANATNKAASKTKVIANLTGLTGTPANGNTINGAVSRTKTTAANIAAKAVALHPVNIQIVNRMNAVVFKMRTNPTVGIQAVLPIRNRTKAVPIPMTGNRIVPRVDNTRAITKTKVWIAASVFMAIKMRMTVVVMKMMTIPVRDAVMIGNMPTAVGEQPIIIPWRMGAIPRPPSIQ
jgi:hypothetical protein